MLSYFWFIFENHIEDNLYKNLKRLVDIHHKVLHFRNFKYSQLLNAHLLII